MPRLSRHKRAYLFRLQGGWQYQGNGIHFPPLASDRGLQEVEKFCDLASAFDVDDDCGFHLHIDVSHLDVVTIRRIAIATN